MSAEEHRINAQDWIGASQDLRAGERIDRDQLAGQMAHTIADRQDVEAIAQEIERMLGQGEPDRRVARIVEEATGYYISNDALPYCDCRGRAHSTRREAIAAARANNYTHYLDRKGRARRL